MFEIVKKVFKLVCILFYGFSTIVMSFSLFEPMFCGCDVSLFSLCSGPCPVKSLPEVVLISIIIFLFLASSISLIISIFKPININILVRLFFLPFVVLIIGSIFLSGLQ